MNTPKKIIILDEFLLLSPKLKEIFSKELLNQRLQKPIKND